MNPWFQTSLPIVFVLSQVLLSKPAAAADSCLFEPLKMHTRIRDVGVFVVDSHVSLSAKAGHPSRDHFDGPVWVIVDGKRRCQFQGGIFSGFHLSESKKYLLTEEYSGSCGQNRTIDLSNCKDVGLGHYCGEGKVEQRNKIVNPPYCEAPDPSAKIASCTTAHVFVIGGRKCDIALNEKASRELTKQDLGVELPLTGSHMVRNPKTPTAEIVNNR